MALSQLVACGSCASGKENEDTNSQGQKVEPGPARADSRKTRIIKRRLWEGEAGAEEAGADAGP
jgi:hypothetical protein